ncbi:TonB-dependent receptor [Myroides phaeus]|uniref:TonB-dependent receptor n=1 Tax=Myroides phaeus TaxID=702745 RepID=UPI00130379A1|nr:carboxypeptidase regulatory-like domain-containing protein [Myroides phaeus]
MRKKLRVITMACTLLFGVQVLSQTTQASIQGIVIENNAVQIGTEVLIRNTSTGFTTRTKTNNSGEFVFKEIPLGGPYIIVVSDSDKNEFKKSGYYVNQGDNIFVDLFLGLEENKLEEILINGVSLKNRKETLGASTAFSASTIKNLPINGRNFSNLTDLSPLSNGASIGGQLGSSIDFTIDGTTAKNPTSGGSTTSRSGAPYSISMEAVREFQVVTNQYDVTLGRSGGGTVSAVTKSGTNEMAGSMFSYMRSDWLSSPYDVNGNKRGDADYATYQYGVSLGGPIIKDKLHYFIAWDHQLDARSLFIADIRGPQDEERYGVTRETLDNFVNIARSKYGVSNKPQYGAFNKRRNSDAAFLRLDWQINENNLLTIRNNFTSDRNPLGLADNTQINLYESYANDKSLDNSLLATLRTNINPKLTNELKLQYLYTFQDSYPGDDLPSWNIPRAIVENVTSNIGNGVRSANIQIGGHRFAQEKFTNNVFQLVNNLYYTTDKINYTFGVDLMQTNAKSIYGSEVNGRFHFNTDPSIEATSIDNFTNLRPYRFYREVPLVDDLAVRGNIFNIGLYGQMQTYLAAGLDITVGLRMDYASYPKAKFNQTVYDELGLKTDNSFNSLIIQPRVQFNWNINEANTDIVRLGGGIFGSDINNYVLINNLTFDGSKLATVDVMGDALPIVNFNDYRRDKNSIPVLPEHQLSTINFTGKNAKVPVVYKANISYTHFFSNKFRVGVTGYMNLGRNNYFYKDRNMVDTPYFTLKNEGNRGVYVPSTSILANGASDWKAGRKTDKLGRVLELVSEGKVNNYALVFDSSFNYYKDGEISVSYTWNSTKDNTSYNGNVANSATLGLPVVDDPRDLNRMSYSNNQFRHKVVVYGNVPSFYGVNVGVRFSGIGGTRYSLLSGGNTNGDFVSVSNDLAYVFDINSADTPEYIKNGLQAILDNPNVSNSLKRYIKSSYGSVADRNGGENGFYGVFDLRVSKAFKIKGKHKFELSADIFNVANLLNKDWGINKSMRTQSLYALGNPKTDTQAALPGFDSALEQFNYRVNTKGTPVKSGNPYQIQVGLKYTFN